MKISIEHVAALAVIAALAYMVGSRRAAAAIKGRAEASVESPAQWWTYAGAWASA